MIISFKLFNNYFILKLKIKTKKNKKRNRSNFNRQQNIPSLTTLYSNGRENIKERNKIFTSNKILYSS